MARARRFGKLSRASRERAARAGAEYGLTRRQVRERYNRGTFNPFARSNPDLRVPREFRNQPRTGGGGIDWSDAALANMERHLGMYVKYNDFNVIARAEDVYPHKSQQVLRVIAQASENELLSWASVQDVNGAPPDIDAFPNLPAGLTVDDVGYYTNGKWNNIFWYH